VAARPRLVARALVEEFWVSPIETVSESEEGFERVYQGSRSSPSGILAHHAETWSTRLVWRIEAF